jgi:hypothetical protein
MTNATDPGHGHSPAAWIAVVVMLVGLSGVTAFFFVGMWTLVWVFAAVTVIGALSGPVLAAMGYGVRGPKYQPKGH